SVEIRSSADLVKIYTRGKAYRAMTMARPQKLNRLKGPDSPPKAATHTRLSQPAFGPASRIHAMAPRNGGMMNAASTLILKKPRNGMLVRDTPQAMGRARIRLNAVAVMPRYRVVQRACT